MSRDENSCFFRNSELDRRCVLLLKFDIVDQIRNRRLKIHRMKSLSYLLGLFTSFLVRASDLVGAHGTTSTLALVCKMPYARALGQKARPSARDDRISFIQHLPTIRAKACILYNRF